MGGIQGTHPENSGAKSIIFLRLLESLQKKLTSTTMDPVHYPICNMNVLQMFAGTDCS